MVERTVRDREVVGSNPAYPTPLARLVSQSEPRVGRSTLDPLPERDHRFGDLASSGIVDRSSGVLEGESGSHITLRKA